MKQLQIYPNNKTEILVSFAWFYGAKFNFKKYRYEDRPTCFRWELNLPFMNIDYSYDSQEPTMGWDSRYDLTYDLETLEYTEDICNCVPETCEYTDAYRAAGSPKYYKSTNSRKWAWV